MSIIAQTIRGILYK